jgi:TP901 family phage tail tape measure protein
MADVNANIGVNIDTSAALAQLKSLQRQISQFHTSISKSSESAAIAQKSLQKNLLNSVNAIGAFSAELRTVRTSAESFTASLEGNKFSMREYFRYAGASTKTFGRLFKSEFDTIGKVAEERVKRLQTQYIKLGRDTNGAMQALAVTPTSLNMNDYGTKVAMAAQKQALFNQLMKQGSTNLLNFGKNTQWAGRQLMVGFTIPLTIVGSAATKTFMEMEAQALKFKKVYGDLFTPQEETQVALDNITELGRQFTKYGIAVSQTVGLASEAAAAGFQGLDLQRQTTEATRLSVLGQIDSQQALETTIALQNAFGMSSDKLADSINFLNAVENQTVVSLDDITIAIPKVAPVIQQLGGDVKDLTFFIAAMKEGGINASEGANALKSGLAALINPTTKANAMLKQFGINASEIVTKNKGNLKATVIEFATALNQLDPLNRAQAIEQMFGKFQFARLSTLFANVAKDGNQAARVLGLANSSVEELSSLSEKELGMTAESSMNKFKKTVEDLKVALIPVGQAFLEAVTPILEFVGNILEKFGNLSSGTKKVVTLITLGIAGLGPIFLMTFGLLANLLANAVKGAMILRNGYLRLTGQSQILGEQTQYLTMEQIEAAAAAHSLDQSHARLTQQFTAEASAVSQLIAAYQQATVAGQKFMLNNPGMMLPGARKGYANGVISVPGSGKGDTVPAMLTPGEAVIPAAMAKKYAPLIEGMIAGNIPGYRYGKRGSDFAHVTGREQTTIGSILSSLESLPAEIQKSRSGLIAMVRDLVATFGSELKAFRFSGLGFSQSPELNRAMSNNKEVPASKFLEDFSSRGTEKWQDSMNYAGVQFDSVAQELEVYDRKLKDAVQKILDLNNNATITSTQFAAIEKEVRATLPEFSQLRVALDTAESTMTEFRYNMNQSDVRKAGLSSYTVPSSKDPSKISDKPRVQTRGGREVRVGGDHQFINVPGGFNVEDTIYQIKKDAGTASPSKKTIPIGEDIARGLEVGMANRQDDVAKAGSNLSVAAVSGTQKTRRVSSRPQGAPSIPMSELTDNRRISPETQQTLIAEAKARESATQKMQRLDRSLMGASFAISSLSGMASMSGGKLGQMSGTISKVTGAMFALQAVTSLLTQTSLLKLATDKSGLALGAMKSAKEAGSAVAGAAGRSGIIGSLSRVALGLKVFLGPIGLVTTALSAAYAGYKIYAAGQERARMAVFGLADAMTMTSDKIKVLNNLLGQTSTPRPGSGATIGSVQATATERGQIDELKKDKTFQDTFKKDIQALKDATVSEANLAFNTIALDLAGQGYSKDAINIYLKSLAEEADKTDVLLKFKQIDISTKEGQAAVDKLAKQTLNQFNKAFKGGFKIDTFYKDWNGNKAGDQIARLNDSQNKAAAESAAFLSARMVNLTQSFGNQTIKAEQYNKQMAEISSTIPKGSAGLLLMNKVLLNISPKFAKASTQVKDYDTKLLLVRAALTNASVAQTIFDDLISGVPAKVDAAKKALEKLAIANNKTANNIIPTDDYVPPQETGTKAATALSNMQDKIKAIREQAVAYNKLRAAGASAAIASDMAADSLIAAAVASGQIDISKGKWKDLVKQLETVEKKADNVAKKLGAASALDDLKQQKKDIDAQSQAYTRLIKAGYDTKEAQELVNNVDMANLINNPEYATISYKKLRQIIDATSKSQEKFALKVDPFANVKKSIDKFGQAFDQAMEHFRIQEAQARQALDPLIKAAKTAVDEVQKEIDKINKDAETALKPLNDESTVLSNNLAIIDHQSQAINDKYDLQASALQQISEINSEIAGQQKQQLTLADALSQGDISAAAAAAQDMRASAAQNALGQQTGSLEAARKKELDALLVNGMTRAQIEERQYQISQQIYAIEQKRNLDLDTQNSKLEIQKTKLEALEKKLQDQLDVIDNQRIEWDKQKLIVDALPGTLTNINGILKDQEAAVLAIAAAWAAVSAAQSSGGGGGGGFVTKTDDLGLTDQEIRDLTKYEDAIFRPGAGMGFAKGGLVPKYFAKGGLSRGTDTVPAMLTPGEFVMSKSSVDKYGPMLSAMNNPSFKMPKSTSYSAGSSGSNTMVDNSSAMYNYNIGITVPQSNASSGDIANAVISQIKYIDAQRIRGQR